MTSGQVSNADAVRVAVVGAGGWGEQHARIFSRRSDTHLCAVVGRNEVRARARAAAYGATAYTDIAAMLDASPAGPGDGRLPNESTLPRPCSCRSGVPLLVEKPLVFDLAEADTFLPRRPSGRPVLRRSTSTTATPSRCPRQGRRSTPVTSAIWSSPPGGSAARRTRQAPARQADRDAVPRVGHARAPVRADRVGDGADGRQDTTARTRRSPWRWSSPTAPSAACSAPTTRRTPTRTHSASNERHLGPGGDPRHGRVAGALHGRRRRPAIWQAGYFNDEARGFALTFDRHVDAMLAAFRAGGPPPVHARAGRRALELAVHIIDSFDTGRRVDTTPDGPTDADM